MLKYVEWYYKPESGRLSSEEEIAKRKYIKHYVRRAFARHNFQVTRTQFVLNVDESGQVCSDYPFALRIFMPSEDMCAFTLADSDNGSLVLETLHNLLREGVKRNKAFKTLLGEI